MSKVIVLCRQPTHNSKILFKETKSALKYKKHAHGSIKLYKAIVISVSKEIEGINII